MNLFILNIFQDMTKMKIFSILVSAIFLLTGRAASRNIYKKFKSQQDLDLDMSRLAPVLKDLTSSFATIIPLGQWSPLNWKFFCGAELLVCKTFWPKKIFSYWSTIIVIREGLKGTFHHQLSYHQIFSQTHSAF